MKYFKSLLIFSLFFVTVIQANSQSIMLSPDDWTRQKSTGKLMQFVGLSSSNQLAMKPIGENTAVPVSLSDLELKPKLAESDVLYYNNSTSSVYFKSKESAEYLKVFTASIVGLSRDEITIRHTSGSGIHTYAVLPVTAVFGVSIQSFKNLQVGDIAFWHELNTYVWVDRIFSDGSVQISAVLDHTSDAMSRFIHYTRAVGSKLLIAKAYDLKFHSRNNLKGPSGEIKPVSCDSLLNKPAK